MSQSFTWSVWRPNSTGVSPIGGGAQTIRVGVVFDFAVIYLWNSARWSLSRNRKSHIGFRFVQKVDDLELRWTVKAHVQPLYVTRKQLARGAAFGSYKSNWPTCSFMVNKNKSMTEERQHITVISSCIDNNIHCPRCSHSPDSRIHVAISNICVSSLWNDDISAFNGDRTCCRRWLLRRGV